MNCEVSKKNYERNEEEIHRFADEINKIVGTTGEILEGSCFTYHRSTEWAPQLRNKRINLLAAASGKQHIFELGVNASHSLLLFLLGSDTETKIDALDIGEHGYVQKTFDFLKRRFPNRKLSLQIGDSRESLVQRVLKEKETNTYDLIHMDGGHTADCVVNDILLLTQLLKPNGWLIVDDINDPFICSQVTRLVRLGIYRPISGQLPTELYQHVLLEKI
jgi:predicted O-methyltransferase YrrM